MVADKTDLSDNKAKNKMNDMRKFLLVLAAFLPLAIQAEEANDTTFTYKDKKIVVDVDNGKTNVQVYDMDGNKQTKSHESTFVDGQEIERIYVGSPFVPRPKNKSFRATLPLFFMGLGGMTQSLTGKEHGAIHSDNSRSWELGVSVLETSWPVNAAKTLGFVTGLQGALNYNHIDRAYRMLGNSLVTADYDRVKKSYLKYTTIRVPLFFEYQEQYKKHRMYFGLGLSLDWRNNLKSKCKYTDEDGFGTIVSTVHVNHWGLNLEYHIGIDNISLYIRSALTPLYKLDTGKKAYPFNIGFGISL